MLIRWRHVAATLVALPLLGLFIGWLGIIPLGASGGHWAVTDWFLHWVMRNSTRTAALRVETPPPLDDPARLPLAAGQFEMGCARCHGSPAQGRSAATLAMLPPPPDLARVVPTWTDAELFQIVQHGIRYTGMPAWPTTNREDEVWSMVAFLRKVPDMHADTYRQLAGLSATPSGTVEPPSMTCDSCHAESRLDAGSLIPSLAGQSEAYLLETLRAYAEDKRPSGVMQTAMSALDKDEFAALAAAYAARPRQRLAPESADPQALDHGRRLADTGDAGRRIPACLTCHEKPDGNPSYPRLSGQSPAYLATQLRLFVSGKRGGGPYADLMRTAAENLDEADIQALSAYFASR